MLSMFVAVALLGSSFAMPFNSTAVDDLAQTTTPIDCSLYRPYPADPNMYEVYNQQVWLNRTCPQALVWDQDLCRCENPPVEDMDCPGKRPVPTNPRQYEEQVWGVWQEIPKECPVDQIWNQTACRCDWDPEGPGAVESAPGFDFPAHMRSCEIMFNATFNRRIEEHQSNYYIQSDPWGAVNFDNSVSAVGGGAARLDGGKMIVWSFAGNDLSDVFQVKLSFKMDAAQAASGETVTLFSNDCSYDDPSVYLQYTPSNNSYVVFLRDSNTSDTLYDCPAPENLLDFHTVSLEYQDNILVLRVDGENVCGSSKLSGKPARSQCPLNLGGDSANRNLQGYLDEVVIRRNCVVQA